MDPAAAPAAPGPVDPAALVQLPDQPALLNGLARVLMTVPHAPPRDYAEAVELGRRACELTDYQEPLSLDTLATAYASAGQFAEAVQWQQKAVELAPEEEKEDYRFRLALYEAGKPLEMAPEGILAPPAIPT